MNYNRKLLAFICDLLNKDKPDGLLKCGIKKSNEVIGDNSFSFSHKLVLWVSDTNSTLVFLEGYVYSNNYLVVTIGGYTQYVPLVIRQGTKSMFEKWEKENNNG